MEENKIKVIILGENKLTTEQLKVLLQKVIVVEREIIQPILFPIVSDGLNKQGLQDLFLDQNREVTRNLRYGKHDSWKSKFDKRNKRY